MAAVLLALMLPISPLATAGEPDFPREASDSDKSGYDLFHPTPRALMRPMSTDRPTQTESAYTVDAGHLQVELDLFTYVLDREPSASGDVSVNAFSIAPVNVKFGVLNWMDLQLLVDSFNQVKTSDSGTGSSSTSSGFGDVTPRVKMNLWGNDGGPTALAIMPFVVLDTGDESVSPSQIQGGIIVPFAASLPAGWRMGLMTELDFLNADAAGDHALGFVNSISFSHTIAGDLSGYLEFWSLTSTRPGSRWVGTFDMGLVYAISENVQLDVGVNLGVTDSADDFNPFLGVSVRF